MKILNNLKLIFQPILINACLYFRDGHVRHENWGDDINYYFLKEICETPIEIFNQFSLAYRLNLKNYLCIGSIIDMLGRKNSEVWGAGIIDENKPLRIKPKKVHAVRGPLTRKKLLAEGVDCPEVYGDPALLVAKYYQPKVEKTYKYGFISHISNLNMITRMTIDGMPIKERTDVLIIDLSKYDKWTDIPDQICSCENILSSSLHGLILAEAYKIPNAWLEFGKPLIGGHFKFHDFFTSIGKDRKEPIIVESNIIPMAAIHTSLQNWQAGHLDVTPLLNACPFKIKKTIYE